MTLGTTFMSNVILRPFLVSPLVLTFPVSANVSKTLISSSHQRHDDCSGEGLQDSRLIDARGLFQLLENPHVQLRPGRQDSQEPQKDQPADQVPVAQDRYTSENLLLLESWQNV